ncbi:MAG: hypothetical protein EAZ51_09200 [Sphingobacteriales bacterium]|nr:MAG: hypothetical protein EAZ64_00670 [Sphingobacteriales bacterium]TAF78577.1 MAG: hypothetical protein EAZ51_09200 [Sphingobacteriales bacterium]
MFFTFLFLQNTIYAQQNLFNIPSGDITEHKKFFYQHQFNVYEDKLESKAHVVYGLGKGWDAGINIVGKGIYFGPNWRALYNDNPDKGAVYPIAMATVQKQFVISHDWQINAGAQAGWNLSNKIQNKQLNHFSYLIGSYHINNGSKLVGGFYNTNKMFVGQGNTFGVMGGYECKIAKRWYLMGDWVSGNNDASVSVLGGMYNLSKRIQVCAGWLLPNPNTPKPMGVVIELNLLGWDLY